MRSYITFKIILFSLFFILLTTVLNPFHLITQVSTHSIDKPLIRNLTDAVFEEEVANGIPTPWFIVFYMNTCPYCKSTLKLLASYAKKQNEYVDSNLVRLGKVDVDTNMFLGL